MNQLSYTIYTKITMKVPSAPIVGAAKRWVCLFLASGTVLGSLANRCTSSLFCLNSPRFSYSEEKNNWILHRQQSNWWRLCWNRLQPV